jgi:hypothetical protein
VKDIMFEEIQGSSLDSVIANSGLLRMMGNASIRNANNLAVSVYNSGY